MTVIQHNFSYLIIPNTDVNLLYDMISYNYLIPTMAIFQSAFLTSSIETAFTFVAFARSLNMSSCKSPK